MVVGGQWTRSMKECGIWELATIYCFPSNIFIHDRKCSRALIFNAYLPVVLYSVKQFIMKHEKLWRAFVDKRIILVVGVFS